MAQAPTSIACTECGATDTIQIELSIADDTTVQFYSCHQCENRWWAHDEGELEVDGVLKLVRKQRKKR